MKREVGIDHQTLKLLLSENLCKSCVYSDFIKSQDSSNQSFEGRHRGRVCVRFQG